MTKSELEKLYRATIVELRSSDDIGVAISDTRDLERCFYAALDCRYGDDDPEWEPEQIAEEMLAIQQGCDEKFG